MHFSKIATLFALTGLLSLASAVSAQKVAPEPPREFPERSRQIHLDFHTSEMIDSVGADFSQAQFREALRTANVNAINVFAKCHHSWSYYPTKVGYQHPQLKFDLLGEMVKACRAEGVKVFVYLTVGWSANDALRHPEWAALRFDGSSDYRERIANNPGGIYPFSWEYLEPSGPYGDTVLAQLEEIVSNYDVDGIWFDIFKPQTPNFNAYVKAELFARGIDLTDAKAVRDAQMNRYRDWMRKANAIVKKHLPKGTTYFNGITATYTSEDLANFRDSLYEFNSKHDLEDLPTAWGGYDIFPYRSKYFGNTGKPIVAMSGKFHKAWGEFGGFKSAAALKYEAATMVAFGAACNFGDQLHPSGEMDRATYANLGEAYAYVKKIENYGVGGISAARLGLYMTEDLQAVEGATRMVLEEQLNFNVVNTLKDWRDIDVLVLPTGVVLAKDAERIKAFVARGGKVLTFSSSFMLDGKELFDAGVEYVGPGQYDVDYTVVGDVLGKDVVRSPFLNYHAAVRLSPKPSSRVLAAIHEPYFSRTLEHYSSHSNTPNQTYAAAHPAVVERADGKVIAIAHDLDRQYFQEGMLQHRQLFANALARLHTRPMLSADMPSMGRINLLHQPDRKRYVAHVMYASPIQRGAVRVIEDIVPLQNVPVRLELPVTVKRVYLVPDMTVLPTKKVGNRLEVIIPKLDGHAAVVVDY